MTKPSRIEAANIAVAIAKDLELSINKSLSDAESIHFKSIGSDVLKAANDLLSLVTVLDLYEHEYSHLKKYLNNA